MRRFVGLAARGLLAGIVGGALATAPFVYAEFLAWRPSGSIAFLAITATVHAFVMVLSLLLLLPFLVAAAVRPARWWSTGGLACCLGVLVTSVVGARAAYTFKESGITSLVERSRVLTEAIHRFERAHGTPPPSLTALVPEYLPHTPRTGAGAHRAYQYHCVARAENELGWRLSVSIGSIPLDIMYVYYDPFDTSRSARRVGEWAIESH